MSNSERPGLDLRSVLYRPTHGTPEHLRQGRLVSPHQELSLQVLFGGGLPYVATLGKTWISQQRLKGNEINIALACCVIILTS